MSYCITNIEKVTTLVSLFFIINQNPKRQTSLNQIQKLIQDSIPKSKVSIKLGGRMCFNSIYDFNALQHLEAFNTLLIPTSNNHNTSPKFGLGDGQSSVKMNIGYNCKEIRSIAFYMNSDFLGNGFLNFHLHLFCLDIKKFRVDEAGWALCDQDARHDVIDFDSPPKDITSKAIFNNTRGVSLLGNEIILQGTAGSGIASYFVCFIGGGYNAITISSGIISNIPVYVAYAVYELWFDSHLKSLFVYEITVMTLNIENLPEDTFCDNYCSENLFWYLNEKITLGLKAQYSNIKKISEGNW